MKPYSPRLRKRKHHFLSLATSEAFRVTLLSCTYVLPIPSPITDYLLPLVVVRKLVLVKR